MKIFLIFVVLVLGSAQCVAQDHHAEEYDFQKKLRSEIDGSSSYDKLFGDSVVFSFEKQVYHLADEESRQLYWNRVKMLFQGTDYIINFDISIDANVLRVKGLSRYCKVQNHQYSFVLGLTNNSQIRLVQKLIQTRPVNAPPALKQCN